MTASIARVRRRVAIPVATQGGAVRRGHTEVLRGAAQAHEGAARRGHTKGCGAGIGALGAARAGDRPMSGSQSRRCPSAMMGRVRAQTMPRRCTVARQ